MNKKTSLKFKEYLTSLGYKQTPERFEILDAIILSAGDRGNDHFSVEEIFLSARILNHNYALATIYRNLKLFLDSGIIRPISSHSTKKYELIGCSHHDHLICDICGKIEPFFNFELEKLQNKICKSFNFIQSEHQLLIRGICEKCQIKSQKN